MTTPDEARTNVRDVVEGDSASRLLERLVAHVGGHARVEAVFGAPAARSGVTVIPVGRVRWGVGAGGGEADDGSGSGGGGGVVADPIGFIEITDAGAAFRPITHPFGGPMGLLAGAIAIAIVLRAIAHVRR